MKDNLEIEKLRLENERYTESMRQQLAMIGAERYAKMVYETLGLSPEVDLSTLKMVELTNKTKTTTNIKTRKMMLE